MSTFVCRPIRLLAHKKPLTRCSNYATSRRIKIPPPFPIAPSCPEPTCPCAATPDGLDIDHDQDLNGTMIAHSQQLLISTGQQDWTSRIEEDGQDQSWGKLLTGLRKLIGRGGKYTDPYNNILITTSSLSPCRDPAGEIETETASAILFPSFRYVPRIPINDTGIERFTQAFLLPTEVHHAHGVLPPDKLAGMKRIPQLQSGFSGTASITYSPTILICGHGNRDQRCGIMGPLLRNEFRRVLNREGFSVDGDKIDGQGHANVELISHIGGHKYAGNVIIYIPHLLGSTSGAPHALAGKGIWYGRVEPKHVEGLVTETILNGRVVKDHFRGGTDEAKGILRL